MSTFYELRLSQGKGARYIFESPVLVQSCLCLCIGCAEKQPAFNRGVRGVCDAFCQYAALVVSAFEQAFAVKGNRQDNVRPILWVKRQQESLTNQFAQDEARRRAVIVFESLVNALDCAGFVKVPERKNIFKGITYLGELTDGRSGGLFIHSFQVMHANRADWIFPRAERLVASRAHVGKQDIE